MAHTSRERTYTGGTNGVVTDRMLIESYLILSYVIFYGIFREFHSMVIEATMEEKKSKKYK